MGSLSQQIRIALLGLAMIAMAWSQSLSTSQVTGVVSDSSGAAVPGAAIRLLQTDTGAIRNTTSGNDGNYILPSLPAGPYTLEVTKDGFTKYVQSGIVLQVASNPTIPVTLQVGSVTEAVQVEANASLVEVQSTGIGQVIDSQRVTNLPLVGRQVTDLVVLSGGAVDAGTTTTNNRGVYPNVTSFSIAGGLSGGNMFTLDGAFHSDVYALSALPLPFPDALLEFKVETSSLPAQYGYHSGGAITAITRSGTNQFHGSLFEFLRNYAVNGKGFFATTQDGLKRNQWGGTLGAPIKKDKMFFFVGFQGTNTRQTPSDQPAFVPTAAMLSGDFTAYARCQGTNGITLPAPFVNNRVSSNLISSQAIAITKLLPATSDPCGRTNFGIPNASDESFGVGKVDYNFSPTHTIFGRYLGTQYNQKSPYEVSGNALSSVRPGASDLLQSATLSDTYLFGASVVNTFRATYNRTSNAKVPGAFFSAADVGINIFQYTPKYTSLTIPGGFAVGGNTGNRATYNTVVAQLGDDVGVNHGSHQMAFGANLVVWQSNSNSNTFTPGLFEFNGTAAGQGGLPPTGNGLAEFLLGRVTTVTQGAPNKTYAQEWYLGLYAQDSWKLRRGLTLSYGVRWEPYFPVQPGQGIMTHFDRGGFDAGIKSTQYVNAPPGLYFPGDKLFGPNGTATINKRWNQFAPRIGIVWDPTGSGKTIIRSGYGIFYDQNSVELFIQAGQGPPWGGKVVLNNPVGGLADPWRNQAGGNPFPFVLSPTVPFAAAGTFITFNENTRLPYVQQWNFGIQRQVGKDWLLTASYIGNQIVHLYGQRALNPAVVLPCANGIAESCNTIGNTQQRRILTRANPTEGGKYGFLDVWDDGGTRNYNGLLLSTQKRMSRGISVSANYTWSHCIGNPFNTFPNGGTNGYFALTRKGDRGDCTASGGSVGNAGTDRRHLANFTGLASMPRFNNKALRLLASDWRSSATVSMLSGAPVTIVTGVDTARVGFNGTTQYANQLRPNVYGDGSPNNWLNVTPGSQAFAAPTIGTRGNMGPGTVRGAGALIFNAGISRLFPIKERHVIELRAEAQNVLNRTNFDPPIAALNNTANFGKLVTAGPARIMQFALKYVF